MLDTDGIISSMTRKLIEKEETIRLRESGKTYTEILRSVPVAKSTLAIWLREAGLAKTEDQRMTDFKRHTQKLGAHSRRTYRQFEQEAIYAESESQISPLSMKDLWYLGTALYWAEGSKESESHPGSGIVFSNQDYRIIGIFLKFLTDFCEVQRYRIHLELYIHFDRKDEEHNILLHWSSHTGFPIDNIKVYYKHNTRSKNRQNDKKIYHGVLRVKVSSSSGLLRRIHGWTNGISKNCGLV